MNTWFVSFVCIIFCLVLGYSSALFQSDSMITWYPNLDKSSLTPPGFVFPIVWTILYICIGLALAYVIFSKSENKTMLIVIWSFQMLFNFLWSFMFFYLKNPTLGFIDIVLLDITVLLFIIYSFTPVRNSSILFMPYMAWLLLATYLNGYIMFKN